MNAEQSGRPLCGARRCPSAATTSTPCSSWFIKMLPPLSKPVPPVVPAGLEPPRGCLPRACRDPRGTPFPPSALRPASALTRDSLEGSSYVPAPSRRPHPGRAGAVAPPPPSGLKNSNGKSRPAPAAPEGPQGPQLRQPCRPPPPGAPRSDKRGQLWHLGGVDVVGGVAVPDDYQEGERSGDAAGAPGRARAERRAAA